MNRWNELKELTRVRVLLFVRQPEVLFWVLAFPLLLAAVLGYAFRSSGPAPSKVGIVPNRGAEVLMAQLEDAAVIEVEPMARDVGERNLYRGVIDVLIVPGTAGQPPELVFDPQRNEAETARLRVLVAIDDAPPAFRATEQTAVGSRYIDFLFPGLLGMNLMGTGMWMIGFTVAELRQKKLLKRMLVTPMRRSSFLLSFLCSRLVFFAMEMAALVAFGAWVLGVPFRANAVSFGLLSLVGAFVFAGLGMLATARVKTVQGASGFINLFMMPMWLCSGVFFSYERFPEALQPVLRVLPLSALNDGLRALMLDGDGLAAIASELVILVLWGSISFLLALGLFRWE